MMRIASSQAARPAADVAEGEVGERGQQQAAARPQVSPRAVNAAWQRSRSASASAGRPSCNSTNPRTSA